MTKFKYLQKVTMNYISEEFHLQQILAEYKPVPIENLESRISLVMVKSK